MKFIEALKHRSKLFFLFLLITLGLVSIAIMGTVNINTMKKNLDSLYFGSLVPVTELDEILQTYHANIASTFYKSLGLELTPNETFLHIEASLLKINALWESYEKHFKRDEEIEYVEYVSSEIKATNRYFEKMLETQKVSNELSVASTININKQITHIDAILKKLIKYEIDTAKFDRQNFILLYDATLLEIGVILLFIIFAVLLISYLVFSSIQKDHTELEETTKKLISVNKKLETVSYTDALTSLHNRRYFNMVYERELKRAKRTRSFITFMMIDIDYFKQYNDTYGHAEGDTALIAVAHVLQETLQRASDFIFRLGGEEFGVLLTQTDEDNSALLAQKLCDNVRECKIAHESSMVSEFLTISIGVVSCVADEALDKKVLILHADKMLYKAKESGRNGFVTDSNVSETTIVSEPWSVEEVRA